MFSLYNRLKLLSKIAQQTTSTTTPQTTTTTATIAPPPNFQASGMWGWLTNSYNSYTITLINNLISILNTALQYASNGEFNFQILKDQSFQVDISSAPSVDAKNILNLSILLYKTFLNSGNQFPQKVSSQQIKTWIELINNSQALMNLSQLNPTGIIAQKIPGNLKDNIINYLRYISLANPA